MLNKRIKNKEVLKKVLIGLLIALPIMGIFTMFSQHNKINNLKNELYSKQQIEQKNSNYTETYMHEKTIETEFNKLKEYKIFNSTVNIKHKYILEEDSILGLKKRATLSATSDIYYQFDVMLADADIKEDENEINIIIPMPILNEYSVHRVKDTFHIIEDETTSNILCNKDTLRKTQQFWEDSLIDKSYGYIKDYYTDKDKIKILKCNAEDEVKSLVETFVRDKKIIVKVGE